MRYRLFTDDYPVRSSATTARSAPTAHPKTKRNQTFPCLLARGKRIRFLALRESCYWVRILVGEQYCALGTPAFQSPH
jgi:hypothetical protein